MSTKSLSIIIICLCLIQCTAPTESAEQATVKASTSPSNQVYNYNNQEQFTAFQALQLDETHANLLNPQVAKESYQEVSQAWVKLHADIGSYLAKNDFNWNSSDSTIKVFHKIYFDNIGHVKHHFINVLTPTISKAKVDEFSNLLKEFGSTYQVDLKRASAFAQCGKAAYTN